ncbi:MAG: chromophore lyase CpcT/CpeT [Pleurocapsa sp.]
MTLSPQIITLARYLAGEFDNQQQALAEPAWYVHLRLWLRPVPIFREDSLTLFAEQANIINLDRPYRPRILRIRQKETIEVEYYMFKDIKLAQGGGQNPDLISNITPETIEFLPDCTLKVQQKKDKLNRDVFITYPATETPCSFCYQGNNYQVYLGFEVTENELKTYDKGIEPETGRGIWGALLGAYSFTKIKDFAAELNI